MDFDSNITKRGGFYWKLDINKEIGRLADWLIYKGLVKKYRGGGPEKRGGGS